MSSVVKKPDGFYAKIGPLNGNPKYRLKKLKATTRPNAERELAVVEHEFKRLLLGKSGERVRVADAIDKYIAESLPKLKPGTQETYLGPLSMFREFFAGKYLDQVTRKDLSAYRSWRERRSQVTTATILGDYRVLSSVFSACDAWEFLSANPVPGFLKAQRDLKPAEARTRYLSHVEEDSLLASARWAARTIGRGGKTRAPGWWPHFVTIAIDTGLRLDEMLSLTWDDVSLPKREIRVRGANTKNSRTRLVPILERCLRALMSIDRVAGSPYVFAKVSSGMRYEGVRKPWAATLEHAAIDDLDVHDLRRTCGCRLLQDHRMRMHEVSAWLGHSGVEVTQAHYAFLGVNQLHDAIDESRADVARDKARKIGE